MAGILNTFEKVKRAGDSISSKIDSVKNNFQSAVGNYVANFGSELKYGTATGVNYAGLGEVNTAIETWLKNLETILAGLEAKDPTVAFKGEQYLSAVSDFIVSVKEVCGNVASRLREFEDVMNRAIDAYQARDKQMQKDINTTSDDLKKSHDVYVEKYEHQV